MKTYNNIRIAIAAAIAAAAVTITSCDEETLVAAHEQGMHTITLAAPGSNPETKITATPNAGNTLGIKMAWEVGDDITYLTPYGETIYEILSASDIKGDGSAIFTAATKPPSSAVSRIYYPADGEDAIYKLPSDGESYSKTIEVKSDNSHIEVLMYGDYNTYGGYILNHIYSYMRLEAELPSYAKNPTMRFTLDNAIYTLDLPTGDSLYSVNISIVPASNPSKAKLETSEDGTNFKTVAEKDPDALYAGRQYRMIGEDEETEDPAVAADRAALMTLYNECGGANWADNTNWGSNKPLGEWYGVTTDGNGRVTRIHLDGNWNKGDIIPFGLTGVIPAELGQLTNLTELWLQYNNLSGTIPAELGQLSNLSLLYLNSNKLSGTIPTQFGQLTNLNGLNLADNNLTGSIPTELGQLTNLGKLILTHNRLTGKIPASITGHANSSGFSLNPQQDGFGFD